MNYSLPESLEVGGKEYAIRWDYRAVLDICAALSSVDLDSEEKALAALIIFYPDLDAIPTEHYNEALEKCFWFINVGETEQKNKPSRKLMDWEQDFNLIVGPVSRVIGQDIRGIKNLHWWSFIAAYMEIGDCLFAQVVNIRTKQHKGKKLTKEEQSFYRENQDIIDFRTVYSDEEQKLLEVWGGKGE